MELIANIGRKVWDKILIGLGVCCVLMPVSPFNMASIYRDSGVFLYIGWRILHGGVPYRDIWDHKPPMIYYINALGLALSGSRWGVWVLEFISLFLAAWIGFMLVRKLLGTLPAVFSLYLWLVSMVFVIEGGNLTTEYALPAQFLCLWLASDIQGKTLTFWRAYSIGLLCGIVFLTNQATIGVGIAITLFLIVDRLKSAHIKSLLSEMLIIFLGGLTPVALMMGFFVDKGALTHVISDTFFYNLVYASASVKSRISSLNQGLNIFTKTGLTQLALIGYIATFVSLILRRNTAQYSIPKSFGKWVGFSVGASPTPAFPTPVGMLYRSPLWLIVLIDLPIELILASLPGRSYPHYYMSLLPTLALFAGFTIWLILNRILLMGIPRIATILLIIGVIVLWFRMLFDPYFSVVEDFKQIDDSTIAAYIEQTTSSNDSVLLWGAETTTNFLTQRRSPSRFVYQYPLYKTGYTDEKMIIDFLEDILTHKPRLIIDTRNPLTPMYQFPIQSDAIRSRIASLQQHYRMRSSVDSWNVYEYVDK
jgi:hypothetical protein